MLWLWHVFCSSCSFSLALAYDHRDYDSVEAEDNDIARVHHDYRRLFGEKPVGDNEDNVGNIDSWTLYSSPLSSSTSTSHETATTGHPISTESLQYYTMLIQKVEEVFTLFSTRADSGSSHHANDYDNDDNDVDGDSEKDEIISSRNLERSKADKSKSKRPKGGKQAGNVFDRDELQECKSDLLQCQLERDECIAKENMPTWLFVMTGIGCTLQKTGDNDNNIKLVIKDASKEVWAFTNLPVTAEKVIPTKEFYTLEQIFGKEERPNAAFVFKAENDFETPLVAVILDMEIEDQDSNIKVTYTLEQSEEQIDSASFETYFQDEDTSVEFDMCTVFIDDAESEYGCCDDWCGGGFYRHCSEFGNVRIDCKPPMESQDILSCQNICDYMVSHGLCCV